MFLKIKNFTCNLAYQEIPTVSFSGACSFVQGIKSKRLDALGNWWKCLSYNREVIWVTSNQQDVSFIEPPLNVTRDIPVPRIKIIIWGPIRELSFKNDSSCKLLQQTTYSGLYFPFLAVPLLFDFHRNLF